MDSKAIALVKTLAKYLLKGIIVAVIVGLVYGLSWSMILAGAVFIAYLNYRSDEMTALKARLAQVEQATSLQR